MKHYKGYFYKHLKRELWVIYAEAGAYSLEAISYATNEAAAKAFIDAERVKK